MAIDMSAAVKAPPRRTRTATAKPSTPAVIQQTPQVARANGLRDLCGLGQGVLIMNGQFADAATIGMHGPKLADEIAKVADSYPIVAKPVDFLIKVGPLAGVLTAAVPLVMQIMANHGAIDATRAMGMSEVVPPQVLEAQMQAQVAQMQAEVMRQHQAALAEAQAAQAEIARMTNAMNGEVV